jgi:hypothetical protein
MFLFLEMPLLLDSHEGQAEELAITQVIKITMVEFMESTTLVGM